MKYFDNLTESIGNTPMVILNKITNELPCKVYAKYETFNPGNSVKDRIGLKMIIDAENKGLLKREELSLRELLVILVWVWQLLQLPGDINVFL